MNKTRISAIPLTIIDSVDMPLAYIPGDPESEAVLPQACVFIRIVNNSNQPVFISYDGITDNEYVPSGTQFNFPIQSVSVPVNNLALMAKDTNINFRGTNGTGTITVSGYYL